MIFDKDRHIFLTLIATHSHLNRIPSPSSFKFPSSNPDLAHEWLAFLSGNAQK